MQAGLRARVSDREASRRSRRRPPRVALVHDWLTGMRGGERCLEVFCELFPDAPLYTLLHVPGSVSPVIERRRIVTSFVQRLPAAATALSPVPAAVPRRGARASICRDYDLVLSLSHCVAKAVRVPARRAAPLLLLHADALRVGPGRRLRARARARSRDWLLPPLAAALRRWDRRTGGVSEFVAISRAHRRPDPPRLRPRRRGDPSAGGLRALPTRRRRWTTTTWSSRRWCRTSASIWPLLAANRLGRRLVVVGQGPEDAPAARAGRPRASRSSAGGATRRWPSSTRAAGRCSSRPSRTTASCRWRRRPPAGRRSRWAAAACWRRWSGSTAAPSRPTAVFFGEQTVDALAGAIATFEKAERRFDPAALRARAARFDRPIFARRVQEYVDAPLARVPGGRGVLKAHSRLFEHLALATDLGAHRRLLARRLRAALPRLRRWRRHPAVPRLRAAARADPARVGLRLQGASTSTGRSGSARTCRSGSTWPRPPRSACSSSSPS